MSVNEPSLVAGKSQQGGLPQPSVEAKAHSLRVFKQIQQQIEQHGGRICFEAFMQAALYLPELGYYRCGTEKFGAAGDFITAPFSPLFGQSLAHFIHQTMGNAILEVGAGNGVMALSILQTLSEMQALPEYYYILELSAELRARQRQTLEVNLPDVINRVIWLDALPENFTGVVLANELLDAMPVTRFSLAKDKVYEQQVVCHDGVFVYDDVETNNERLIERIELLKQQSSIDESSIYHSEVNFIAEDWLKSLAAGLSSAIVLLIDYGYPRKAYYHAQRNMGTLMCHYQHRAHPDPLILTGIQDITAHIDFTAIADAALEADMEIRGFASQAHFLLNLGLLDRVNAPGLDTSQDDLVEFLKSSGEVKRLTLPGEMGETFKVMALAKNCDIDVPGFEQFDIRHTL